MKKILVLLLVCSSQVFLSDKIFAQSSATYERPVIADKIIANSEVPIVTSLPPVKTDSSWNYYNGDPHCDGIVFCIHQTGAAYAYIGGAFTTLYGFPAHGLAYFENDTVTEVGGGIYGGAVHAIAYINDRDIYVGGTFSLAGTTPVKNIAHWNGNTWEALGTGTDSTVLSLGIFGNSLYVGGNFHTAGGVPSDFIAIYNTKTGQWEPFTAGSGTGANGGVSTIYSDGNTLYIGGGFTQIGSITAKKIAQLQNGVWSELAGGLSGTNAFAATINASSQDLYSGIVVGGSFDHIGTLAANNIAVFSSLNQKWNSLGSGTNGPVYATNVPWNNMLFVVGGEFSKMDETTVSNIAAISGSTVSSWGMGVDSAVYALAGAYMFLDVRYEDNADFVGGKFATAGGKPSAYFAFHDGPTERNSVFILPSSSALTAFPNPTRGNISIKAGAPLTAIEVTDELGKIVIVMRYDLRSNPISNVDFSVGNLPDGVYSITGKTTEGLAFTRIILRK